MTLSHRVFHPVCQGQWAGRCSVGLRAGAAKRAGTLTRSRRRVAPRATAWLPPARVAAARSRLCAITAQPSQAQFAANSPDGMCASGRLAGTASAETTRDRDLLAASTPLPGVTTVLTNEMIDTINT